MKLRTSPSRWLALFFCLVSSACASDKPAADDWMREIQQRAVSEGSSPVAHWGSDPDTYITWSNHSNRLVPIYCFGTKGAGPLDLTAYTGPNSVYRSTEKVKKLYGRVPLHTVNPDAEYCDQTDVYRLQKAALDAGVKHIFMVVFDGMDWTATQSAAIVKSGKVYDQGKGAGLFFQDYTANGTNQYGYMVTSPLANEARVNVDTQSVAFVPKDGGYDVSQGGPFPWSRESERDYIIGKGKRSRHSVTDSASSATSMAAGIKTFNGSIGVDDHGDRDVTIAHQAQQLGYAVGLVTSVPISHATPAAFYSHNVSRGDYQDISRDLLGLRSISHPVSALPGLDVVLGAGFGCDESSDGGQGANYEPGNRYLADSDLKRADYRNGGEYVVKTRMPGSSGAEHLAAGAEEAVNRNQRLLGYFGTRYGHLPYRTADGDFDPAPGLKHYTEGYTPADLNENPTLAEMTSSAIRVLGSRSQKGFWVLVEAGDVDWAMHKNNIDDMIGAILSGDEAVKAIADWVEANSNWQESLMIVTADHGHYLVLEDPAGLLPSSR